MRECHHRFTAMASPIALHAFAPPARARAAFAAIEAETRRIEARYSRYRPDSVLATIQAAAGGAAVAVDDELAGLLDFADACHRTSGGRFDLTSGALRRAWNFDQGTLPDPGVLAAARAGIGWSRVEWQRPWIRLPEAGMELDLGGLGKEYAADRAVWILREHGITSALANFGGDIAAAGPRPDGSPWRIGIRHPRRPGHLLATLAVYQGGLATSGDYERGMTIDGQRYGHLFDPRTGWPVRGLSSVSVLAGSALSAGALASIALLHGAAGFDFLAESGAPWLAMHEDGTLRSNHLNPEDRPDAMQSM